MDITKKAAEILVEYGYAYRLTVSGLADVYRIIKGSYEGKQLLVDPFADTLEGRRQADAIEDWLAEYEGELWELKSICHNQDEGDNRHQWRLDRIKRCLVELSK